MSDPIEAYSLAKQKLAAERKSEDSRLWYQWKQNPTPETMEPLLKRFEPVIAQRSRMLSGAPNIQPSALQANLKVQAIKAFETYNPDKASLNTHVTNRLRKGLRFVQQHQNLAKIPEATVSLIGPMKSATEELHDRFGRPPNNKEIASYMGISMKKVITVQKSQVKDITGSSFESDPVPRASSREQEVIGLLRPGLSHDEQAVFDHLFGVGGKSRITSTGDIARRLGKSPSQVSRIKGRIEAQYKRFV